MNNEEWLQLLQDLEDLEATLKYTNISSYERVVKKARKMLVDFQKDKRENERAKGEWIGDTDYESCQGMYERYKCSECGYGIDWRKHNQLMCQDEIPEEYREYYCPHCGSKII